MKVMGIEAYNSEQLQKLEILKLNKQKEGWKDEHGMEKTAKDIERLMETFRVAFTQNSLSTSRHDGAFRESAQY